MFKIPFKICFVILVLHIVTNVFGQEDDLKKGWEAFNKNKKDDALSFFQTCAADKQAENKSEALLACALVHWSDDREEAAQEAFREFFSSVADPYPYAYALWQSDCINKYDHKKSKAQLEFLTKMAADPRANGTIRAMISSAMGNHYYATGNLIKGDEEFAKIKMFDKWQVLGDFDNSSSSGFDKDFGALSHPKPGAVFKNKVNADVTWFKVEHIRSDRWFDFDFHFSLKNGVFYAQTFINSEISQDAILRSGVSGSLKIWVNDKLVTNVSQERNCDLDIYNNRIKLQRGYNRLLVQVAESETERANFMVRITDSKGNPLQHLTASADYQDYSLPKEDYKAEEIPFFAEQFFEDKIKADPGKLINYLMIAEIYLANDKVYEARKCLKKALELAPENSFIMSRMIEALSRAKNITDRSKLEEKIKSMDPEGIYALTLNLNEALAKENMDDAQKSLDKMESIYGKSAFTQISAIQILSKQNKYDQAVKIVNEMYEKYPDSYSSMVYKYKTVSNDLGRANQVLKTYLKNNNNDNIKVELAANYFKLGQKDRGIAVIQERLKQSPYAIGYYDNYADLLVNMGEYKEALQYQLETTKKAPYMGYYWNKLGDIYQNMDHSFEAIEAYKKSIYYQPTNYEARNKLRKIQGKKDPFENFTRTDVYDLYKHAPGAAEYPEDNSVILTNEGMKVVYPEGAVEERAELLVKVLNQAGVQEWSEYSIPYNSFSQKLIVDKAEVLKQDGNKVQAEAEDNYLVFTSLSAGDAIHISYRIENYHTGALARHFWDKFYFNYHLPSRHNKYSLVVPKDKEFRYQMLNADFKPEIKELDEYKIYTWKSENQPAMRAEPYMPPVSDASVTLEISSIPDWGFISGWYADLALNQAKTDIEVQEINEELFKNKTGLSELERAKIIYNYMTTDLNYSNVSFMHSAYVPQKASRTLNTKLGDCKDFSTLFVALAKEAKLNARLVLVDTRDNGLHDMMLPSPNFNHCIAEVEAGGKKYVVELTDKKMSFGTVCSYLMNSLALKIPVKNEPAFNSLIYINSDNRVANTVSRKTKISIEKNNLIVCRNSCKSGQFAVETRYQFGDKDKEGREKALLESISGDFSANVKMVNMEFKDLSGLKDTVNINYTFEVKNAVNEIAGMQIVKLPWCESNASLDFVSPDNRSYPFYFWMLNSLEKASETISMEIPKGRKLVEMPKNVRLNSIVADYELIHNIVGNKLVATRKIVYKKDVIAPAEYETFKEFFIRVSEADSKQLAFK